MNILKAPQTPEQTQPQQQPFVAATGSLKELDLDKELLNQYNNARKLFDEIEFDNETPTNQKASVLNTITTILREILKMQQDLHNIERVKLIEVTLINVLKQHETLREAFLKDYEEALKAKL